MCVSLQQKEVDFLENENQLLEGYLQRVRLIVMSGFHVFESAHDALCGTGCSIFAGVSERRGATGVVTVDQSSSRTLKPFHGTQAHVYPLG